MYTFLRCVHLLLYCTFLGVPLRPRHSLHNTIAATSHPLVDKERTRPIAYHRYTFYSHHQQYRSTLSEKQGDGTFAKERDLFIGTEFTILQNEIPLNRSSVDQHKLTSFATMAEHSQSEENIQQQSFDRKSLVVPVHRSQDRLQQAFWGQSLHHHQRRRLVKDTDVKSWNWRSLSLASTDNTINLSSCHLILWSGEISIGTPAQPFIVDFDTGSSDIWVASSDCGDSCSLSHPNWRRYDYTLSSTYQGVSSNSSSFLFETGDGTWLQGNYARDVVRLTPHIAITNQVFAQVTDIFDYETCGDEEGVVGLGYSATTAGGEHLSILKKIVRSNLLTHNMFSVYLAPVDDYVYGNNNENKKFDNDSTTANESEILFGGINPSHYHGCLQWHTQHEQPQQNKQFDGHWKIALDKVTMKGKVLLKDNDDEYLALIDSGSSYVVGPTPAVLNILNQHSSVVSCFVLDQYTDTPTKVDCQQEEFHVISMNCNDPFATLTFVVDEITYELEKDDLLIPNTNSKLNFGHQQNRECLLRLAPSDDIPGWVLGDPFLNKYYSVYDLQNGRIGLAEAARDSGSTCTVDAPYDITLKEPSFAPRDSSKVQYTNNGDDESINLFRPKHSLLIAILVAIAIMSVFIMLNSYFRRRRQRQRRSPTNLDKLQPNRQWREVDDNISFHRHPLGGGMVSARV